MSRPAQLLAPLAPAWAMGNPPGAKQKPAKAVCSRADAAALIHAEVPLGLIAE